MFRLALIQYTQILVFFYLFLWVDVIWVDSFFNLFGRAFNWLIFWVGRCFVVKRARVGDGVIFTNFSGLRIFHYFEDFVEKLCLFILHLKVLKKFNHVFKLKIERFENGNWPVHIPIHQLQEVVNSQKFLLCKVIQPEKQSDKIVLREFVETQLFEGNEIRWFLLLNWFDDRSLSASISTWAIEFTFRKGTSFCGLFCWGGEKSFARLKQANWCSKTEN